MTLASLEELTVYPALPKSEWRLRPAGMEDIPALVDMRVQLFQSIQLHPEEELNLLAQNCWSYFAHAIPSGAYRAWVAETATGIVATGGVIIHQTIPTILNAHGREGYVVGMYTLPEWRKLGIARAIIQTILDFLRQEGVAISTLRATVSGRPLYERIGFENTSEMRLILDPSPAEPHFNTALFSCQSAEA